MKENGAKWAWTRIQSLLPHTGSVAALVPVLAAIDYLAGALQYRSRLKALGLEGAINPDFYDILQAGPLVIALLTLLFFVMHQSLFIIYKLFIWRFWRHRKNRILRFIFRILDINRARLQFQIFGATFLLLFLYTVPFAFGTLFGQMDLAKATQSEELLEVMSAGQTFRGVPLARDRTRLALRERSGRIDLLKWDEISSLRWLSETERRSAQDPRKPLRPLHFSGAAIGP